MNKNNWYKLFNDKKFNYYIESQKTNINPFKLAKVIFVNLTPKKFKIILNFFEKKLNLKKTDKFLDFGSGNGAFLLHFQKKVGKIYSIEISKPLIKIQKKNLRKVNIISANPYNVNFFKKLKDKEIDVTIANSVFQYFCNENYCKNVLSEMIRVTKKTIFIYDIKDKTLKSKFLSNAMKKQNLSINQFKKKYKYTPQRFYYKKFFKRFLNLNFPNKKIYFYDLPKAQEDNKYGYCLKIT